MKTRFGLFSPRLFQYLEFLVVSGMFSLFHRMDYISERLDERRITS